MFKIQRVLFEGVWEWLQQRDNLGVQHGVMMLVVHSPTTIGGGGVRMQRFQVEEVRQPGHIMMREVKEAVLGYNRSRCCSVDM
jgi:hypothetical protein